MKVRRYLLVFALCWSQLTSVVHADKEDISPLPSVNFGRETSREEAVLAGEVSELLNALQQSTHYETKLTVVQTLSQEEFTASTREVLRQDQQWYVRLSAPDRVASSVFLQTDKEDASVEEMWLSLNDMMSYTADVMTQYPEQYAGTAMASFYEVFSERPDDFVDRYVEAQTHDATYKALYDDTRAFERFAYTLAKRWMTELADDPNATTYKAEEDKSEQLSALIHEVAAEYPSVLPLIEKVDGMFVGTIQFDIAKQEIGIGLITPQGAIEYFMRLSDNVISQPLPNQVMTESQFHDVLGFDLFTNESEQVDTEEGGE